MFLFKIIYNNFFPISVYDCIAYEKINDSYVCTVCSRENDSIKAANRHYVSVHNGKKPIHYVAITHFWKKIGDKFGCIFCKDSFNFKCSLMKHYFLLHFENDSTLLTCDHCGFRCHRKESLVRHFFHIHDIMGKYNFLTLNIISKSIPGEHKIRLTFLSVFLLNFSVICRFYILKVFHRRPREFDLETVY